MFETRKESETCRDGFNSDSWSNKTTSYAWWAMLSLNECRKLIDDSSFSDEEILRIRDACYELADIALEHIDSLQKGARRRAERGDNTAMPSELRTTDS